MPNYYHVIWMAFTDILGRGPDEAGLAAYQTAMNAGLTEAQLRESLIRSPEFNERFKDKPGPFPPQPPGPIVPPVEPPPPPPPSGNFTMEPLIRQGNRFATASKGPINLLGVILCCDDPRTPGVDEAQMMGWPAFADTRVLDVLAQHKLNYLHLRLGPFGDSEPNPVQAYKRVEKDKFDLSLWEPAFWNRLREVIRQAEERGIYVELDVIDVWGLDHAVTPWSGHRNVNGVHAGDISVIKGPPQEVHLNWVRKIMQETAMFPNVIYQDGNEAHKGSSNEWVTALSLLIPDNRLFGSNTGREFPTVDYATFHQRTAVPAGKTPRLVNEYQTLPPERVIQEAARGISMGTSFMYWRGEHNQEETERTLAGLKKLMEGEPPPPVAAVCPRLARWGSSLHVYHRNGMLLPVPVPRINGNVKNYGQLAAGTSIVIDSTPRFGAGNGQPCNDEKGFDACGGRNCEDPRGPIWEQIDGPTPGRTGGNPFQYEIGRMAPGSYRIVANPRSDMRDAEGKVVQAGPQAWSEVRFTVS